MTNHQLFSLSPFPIAISWHENRRIFFSARLEGKTLSLKLHKLFFDSPTPVLEAIISYAIKKDIKSKRVIRQMAHLYFSKVTIESSGLNPIGKHFDLKNILEKVSKGFSIENITIGWGKKHVKSSFKLILFGSFDRVRQEIRIHPLLDSEGVPLYFLEFIVYHEMLHAVCPTKMDSNGRCQIHTKEFRDLERQFPEYEKAKNWEKVSLAFFKKRKF